MHQNTTNAWTPRYILFLLTILWAWEGWLRSDGMPPLPGISSSRWLHTGAAVAAALLVFFVRLCVVSFLTRFMPKPPEFSTLYRIYSQSHLPVLLGLIGQNIGPFWLPSFTWNFSVLIPDSYSALQTSMAFSPFDIWGLWYLLLV